jgi:hypothetical protein
LVVRTCRVMNDFGALESSKPIGILAPRQIGRVCCRQEQQQNTRSYEQRMPWTHDHRSHVRAICCSTIPHGELAAAVIGRQSGHSASAVQRWLIAQRGGNVSPSRITRAAMTAQSCSRKATGKWATNQLPSPKLADGKMTFRCQCSLYHDRRARLRPSGATLAWVATPNASGGRRHPTGAAARRPYAGHSRN